MHRSRYFLPFVAALGIGWVYRCRAADSIAPSVTVQLVVRAASLACFSLDPMAVTDETGRVVAGVEEEVKVVARPLEGRLELVTSAGDRMAAASQLTLQTERGFSAEVAGRLRAYRGHLVIRVDNGAVTAVHRLSLEDYLLGVLPLEATPAAPTEYLRAHAIASRSAALARAGRHRQQGFDLCGQTHCEMYGGEEVERPTTTAAVVETRGKAMLANGRAADATYSTNCGGVTSGNEEVWLNPPASHLRPIADVPDGSLPFALPLAGSDLDAFLRQPPECNCAPESGLSPAAQQRRSEAFRWRRSLSASEIEKRVAMHSIGVPQDVRVLERGASGRAREMKIIGDKNFALLRGDAAIRAALSLPSSLFDLEIKRGSDQSLQEVVFVGAGFGHGVGMCQHGAMDMARRGATHEAILRKYFAGVELRQWY